MEGEGKAGEEDAVLGCAPDVKSVGGKGEEVAIAGGGE